MTGNKLIAFAAAFLAVMPIYPAHAYVDPGSGTFILQILGMLALGAMFYLRVGIDKIKSWMRILTGSPRTDSQDEPSDDKKSS